MPAFLSESQRTNLAVVGSQKERTGDIFTVNSTKQVKCRTEFYKFVKRRKESSENIPAIKDCNVRFITNSIGKGSSLNFHYASVCGCDPNIPQIKQTHSGEPFNINVNMIRKRPSAMGRKESIGPDGIPAEFLKLGWGRRKP
jgi:hypothetical protein